jgi:hypothetical protein
MVVIAGWGFRAATVMVNHLGCCFVEVTVVMSHA